MVRLSRWLLRSPKPAPRAARPAFRAEALEDRLVPAGATVSQGDAAILADQVRQLLRLDGSGVTIGVISDSFNLLGGAPGDVSSGDLPGFGTPVGVLSEGGPGGRDEGRAMLQIIHDVAPGARLLFAAAGSTQVQLAASIRALANAGADVIVDDVTFPAEPMFQDGVVAQAVDQCVAAGVVYFSAAGNFGRQSYQAAFVNSGVNLGTGGASVVATADFLAHDFDAGPGEDLYQSVTLPAGRTTISFQWADRYASAGGPGAATDMDLALFDEDGLFLAMIGGFTANTGGDPVEVFEIDAGAGGRYQIALGKVSGPDPALVKYVAFADGFRLDEYDTRSSTVYGHANAAGVLTVGAVRYTDPAVARPFTGRGGTPILFDTAGNPQSPSPRPGPHFVAPDGVNTTFFGSDDEADGFPNFAGTSAAAPHAAGVAALMLQANRGLTPAQVGAALAATALDVGPGGYDADTGAGLIQALPAVLAVGTSFDVILDGTAADDHYLARRDSSGEHVEFYRNGGLVLRLPAAKLGRVTLSGGAGSDSLTVDHSNGAPLASAGLSFAGGETPGDDDRVVFTGYAVEAVVVSHDGPETGTVQVGTTGLVSFAEVEPLVLDGTADDLFVNLPNTPNPDVTVGDDGGPDGFSAVTGSTFESTRFRNPTRKLVVTLGDGGDAVEVRAMDPGFAPAELAVVGGAGGDSVVVFGGGGNDTLAYAPGAADGGVLTLGGGASRVTLTGVEALAADGLGQPGADTVTVSAPRAAVEFGLASGSGLITPASAAGSGLLPLLYRNFEQAAVAATLVAIAGTGYDDTVGISADGTVALGYPGGDGHEIRVTADRLEVNGLDGTDRFVAAANHPFGGGLVLAATDGSDNDLTVLGSGAAVVFTPGITGLVTEAGRGTIRFSGVAHTAVDAGAGWLTLVSVVPGSMAQVLLSGTNAAALQLMVGGAIDVTAAGLTVEAPTTTGTDRLAVTAGSAGAEDVAVAGGFVRFAGRLAVRAGHGVDELAVAGGAGDDTFTVTPGPLPVLVDGGPHTAGDRLVVVGSHPVRPTAGAGSVANVAYQNIEGFTIGSAPAAAPDSPSTEEGQPIVVPVLANDAGLGDGPFTVSTESAPAYGTVQVVGTTVVYTPHPGANSAGGTDSFTYRVEDANGESSVGTVTVTVRPVNDRPAAFTQSAAVAAHGSVGLTLGADDGDAEATQALTFTVLTAPLHGALTSFNPATGQVTYTPFPGYDGPDSFAFAVTDDATAGGPAQTSSPATVFLQVNRANRAPVARPDALTLPQGSFVASPSGGVRSNDTDPDGDPLTVSLVTGPARGTLTLDRRGTYTYTPDPGFSGTDSFVYAVTDPAGATAVATVTVTVTPTARKLIATGAGSGGGPHVKVFDAATGEELYSFFAYDSTFRGGVRVAVGDVNGDGVADIVTTPGPGGGPHVKVFSGADLAPLASFFSFDPNFRSGANVAVGDLDADGVAELVTGAAPGGGSHVRSFSLRGGDPRQFAGPLGSFFAFNGDFAGGVNVALGDYDGVAGDEIVVGAATLFPQVRVYRRDGTIVADFLAFDVARVGITVAAGDVDGDGKADVIVGPGDGGGPVVRTFRGGTGELMSSIAAFDTELRGGISVAAAAARTPDGRAAVIAAPTEQARAILILDPGADALIDLIDAYAADFPGGVFVGAG